MTILQNPFFLDLFFLISFISACSSLRSTIIFFKLGPLRHLMLGIALTLLNALTASYWALRILGWLPGPR